MHLDSPDARLYAAGLLSFNSLQTGRCIWTRAKNRCTTTTTEVSIPFKREGASGPGQRIDAQLQQLKFQFPSNGKVHLDVDMADQIYGYATVFQFPSNGKVHLDYAADQTGADMDIRVSIPFKREGASGHTKFN